MLDRHVTSILRAKLEGQLRGASAAVIAIDGRALALGVLQQAHSFHKAITGQVHEAIQQFVDGAARQVVVLAWFNDLKFPVTRQTIEWPDQVWAFRRDTNAALATNPDELSAIVTRP